MSASLVAARATLPLIIALGLSASPARAATTVSPSGVRSPVMAVDGKAGIAVAWERRVGQGFVVEARTGSGVRGLGRIHRLGAGTGPRVAIGADGTRAVQWVDFTPRGVRRVRVAVARAGRGFGRAQVVESRRANLGTIGLAIQPDGRIVSVHRASSSTIRVAMAPPGRSFGPRRVSVRTRSVGESSITLDPRDGAVLVGYSTPARLGAASQVAVGSLPVGADSFSPPVLPSGDPGESEESGTVVSGPGGAAVVFRRVERETRFIRVALRRADGTWTPPRTAGSLPIREDAPFHAAETAALPSDGSLSVGWLERRYDVDRLVSEQPFAAVAEAGSESGNLPAATPLAPRALQVGGFGLAAAGRDAYAGWAIAGRVTVALRPQGAGGFTSTRTLSTQGDGDLVLAADGDRAYAAWQEGDRFRVTALR